MAESPEAAPSTQLAEYSETEAGLAELRNRLRGVVYDVRSKSGMEQARKDRRECVTLRTTLEALRQKIKAPALERCRLIDAEAKRITGEIEKLESPIDEAIKAEEKRIADEKEAREQAERSRLDAINKRVAWIRNTPLDCVGQGSAAIAETASIVRGLPLSEQLYAELLDEAVAARDAALAKLDQMHAAAIEAEAQAERVAEQLRVLERSEQTARRVQALRDVPARQAGKPAGEIEGALSRLVALEILEELYGERVREAIEARDDSIGLLRDMLAAAKDAEAKAAELKRQKDENDRIAHEQREQQRKLDAQHEAQEAEARRRREADEFAATRRERVKAARRTSAEEALYEIAHVCDSEDYTDAAARDQVLVICEANLPEKVAA
jgi:hypothetical protein